ncbi:MAG: hypothetical protein F9K18_01380 [Thermoanaerobaculia bacterium]|nr:MAG: hypothetical protein F9K18_01380 [Thermoanaerobaculia bacterium]
MAAVAAAVTVWGLCFVPFAAVKLARGGNAGELWVGAWTFGFYGLAFLALLLLFLAPLLQSAILRRLGAAFSAPLAALLALASIVVASLHFADPGDGDPATVAGIFAYWQTRPLEFFLASLPYWAGVALFPWARRRYELS